MGIARHQQRVVGQLLHLAVGQGLGHRGHGARTGFLADDVEDHVNGLAERLRLGPAGQGLGHRVEQSDTRRRVRGDHGIANRAERHQQLLLGVLQDNVGPLQLLVGVFLRIKQALRLQLHQVVKPPFSPLVKQVGSQRAQHHHQADKRRHAEQHAAHAGIHHGLMQQLGHESNTHGQQQQRADQPGQGLG